MTQANVLAIYGYRQTAPEGSVGERCGREQRCRERCGREQRCRGRGGGLQHFIGRTNEARGKLPGVGVANPVPVASQRFSITLHLKPPQRPSDL